MLASSSGISPSRAERLPGLYRRNARLVRRGCPSPAHDVAGHPPTWLLRRRTFEHRQVEDNGARGTGVSPSTSGRKIASRGSTGGRERASRLKLRATRPDHTGNASL